MRAVTASTAVMWYRAPQSMAHELAALQRATHQTVLEGPGRADQSIRRQVSLGQAPPELAGLVQKIRDHAYRVTDTDIDALRGRYSEDQLFELIVAAALGAAEHRLQRALAVLEDACD